MSDDDLSNENHVENIPAEAEDTSSEENEEEPSESQLLDDVSAEVELPHGKALTVEEASSISSAKRTHLIITAGPVESGKTTLIASLFHYFQRGEFAGFLFAGSQTLAGLDERCHLARTASYRKKMHTERTKRITERKLLHLRVREKNLRTSSRDMLFLDISGEHYDEFKDSVDDCREFGLIRRADHFVLLADCEKLMQTGSRQAVKNGTNMMLQSCLDAQQLGPNSFVDILFTKWDLVESDDAKDDHVKFIEHMKSSCKEKFGSKFERMRFFNVAARPEDGNFVLGYGVKEVFPSWVLDTPKGSRTGESLFDEPDELTEFDRFLARQISDLSNEG